MPNILLKNKAVNYEEIHSSIIGKGTVDIPLGVKIFGSSDINCGNIEKLDAHISGKGKLEVDKFTYNYRVKISSS